MGTLEERYKTIVHLKKHLGITLMLLTMVIQKIDKNNKQDPNNLDSLFKI